ncbi:MAG: hypothetical protein V4459_05330 [Pseudomonadota bacterium]
MKASRALVLVLVAAGGIAAGFILARSPTYPATKPVIAAKPPTPSPTSDVRIQKLLKIYHEGRSLEPTDTYLERQQKRYLAAQALKREDPLLLQMAEDEERRQGDLDEKTQVDKMLTNER